MPGKLDISKSGYVLTPYLYYSIKLFQQGEQEDIDCVDDDRHLGDLQLHFVLQRQLGPYPFVSSIYLGGLHP